MSERQHPPKDGFGPPRETEHPNSLEENRRCGGLVTKGAKQAERRIFSPMADVNEQWREIWMPDKDSNLD
jgi:hypothetical protein